MRAQIQIGCLLAMLAGCDDRSIGTLVHEGPTAIPAGCFAAYDGEALMWVDPTAGAVRPGPPLPGLRDAVYDPAAEAVVAVWRDGISMVDLGATTTTGATIGQWRDVTRIWAMGEGWLMSRGPRWTWAQTMPVREVRTRVLPAPLEMWVEDGELWWRGVGHPRAPGASVWLLTPTNAPLSEVLATFDPPVDIPVTSDLLTRSVTDVGPMPCLWNRGG